MDSREQDNRMSGKKNPTFSTVSLRANMWTCLMCSIIQIGAHATWEFANIQKRLLGEITLLIKLPDRVVILYHDRDWLLEWLLGHHCLLCAVMQDMWAKSNLSKIFLKKVSWWLDLDKSFEYLSRSLLLFQTMAKSSSSMTRPSVETVLTRLLALGCCRENRNLAGGTAVSKKQNRRV